MAGAPAAETAGCVDGGILTMATRKLKLWQGKIDTEVEAAQHHA